jgi:hypothetical protein
MCLSLTVCLAVLFIVCASVGGLYQSSSTVSARGLAVANFDPSGNYRIVAASDPDGGNYTGKVNISKNADAYRVTWALPDGGAYEGVAVLVNDTLAIGWSSARDKLQRGVVAYRIQGGKLSGRWTLAGMNGAVGTEELEGAQGLQGSYRIVRSTVPGAKGGYAGMVNITPNGDTYIIEWRLTSGENYKGVGIRQGDVLAVGWSVGAQPGQTAASVATYRPKGAGLEGAWGMPGLKRLGSETLAKE